MKNSMKITYIVLSAIGLLMLSSVSFADADGVKVNNFEVKVKPNSVIPVGQVYSDDPSKIKYNRSRREYLEYEVEVRGRCKSTTAKLGAFRLSINNQTVLDIPVSGDNRSLTGNNGNQWRAHTIRVDFKKDHAELIDMCGSTAHQLLQDQSHDQVFNSNFTTKAYFSGKTVKVYYHCTGGASFDNLFYDTARLSVKALCEATNYQSELWVTESELSLQPITGQDGTCKLNISGEFRTSYELYALRSNNSTAQLRYRFKFKGEGSNVAYSEWWDKTANPLNGGMFLFNYTDRLPASIHQGKVSLEIDIDGKIHKGKAESFSIDCAKALPLQQTQTLDLSLAVVADKSETVQSGGQLCPTHAILTGEITAGYPIKGRMMILGSTLADLYVMPLNLSASQSATQQKRIKLNWPSASNTLSLNGGMASNALKKQTLRYGLNISNSNSEVIKSLPKKNYVVNCNYPSVNPTLPASSSTLGMIPDHTGGGAPTSLTGKLPVNRQRNNSKSVNSGLRSDGELVQGRKSLKLSHHELSHTRQQKSRNFSYSGTNKLSQAKRQNQKKNIPAAPVPLPYPNIAKRKSNTREKLGRSLHTKTTLFRGKVGSRCKKNSFSKNAVIKLSGKQSVVECINGRVMINRTKKVKKN